MNETRDELSSPTTSSVSSSPNSLAGSSNNSSDYMYYVNTNADTNSPTLSPHFQGTKVESLDLELKHIRAQLNKNEMELSRENNKQNVNNLQIERHGIK